jgi:small-conductance mechanosensitive channel
MSNETLRISYTVGIGYADDIDVATRILLDAAAEHDDIIEDPAPSVRVADLADTAVLLQSRFWIADPDREDFSMTRSEYIQDVTERFRAADVDLSTTSQHELAGELTVHEQPPGMR